MASKRGQVAMEARSLEHMERDQSQAAVKHWGWQRTWLLTLSSCSLGGHSLLSHVPCASVPAASSLPRQSPPSLLGGKKASADIPST